MRDNSVLLICLLIIFCVVVFGGHFGMVYSGGIEKSTASTEKPGILNLFDWIWSGITFYFGIIAFQVKGIPAWLSMIILIITLIPLFILLKFVRGTNT
jgi:hypothetical protein